MVGLKNDPEQAEALVPDFDWILVESCVLEGWCPLTRPFRDAGKPVLALEYAELGATPETVCDDARRYGLSAQIKRRELDAWHLPGR
ncbi:endo alpha-1,4 polygalactosaminidase [Hydrogenibacillus sp. N12]|uniref:endo alpha-1,4 polygalactosaminidase n=1 Tax=Hydrogenibacillus sp. N12 TaxID=2866627 RepID=UPI00207BF14D|nr:endo alpha-1,4 polygalactosaminidase [Hydrogenibacillus sp. N12]